MKRMIIYYLIKKNKIHQNLEGKEYNSNNQIIIQIMKNLILIHLMQNIYQLL